MQRHLRASSFPGVPESCALEGSCGHSWCRCQIDCGGPLSAPSCRRSFKATIPAVAPFRSLRGPAGPFQMGRERDEGTSLLIEPHVLKPPAVENAVDDQVEALDARPPAGRGAGVEDDRARGVAREAPLY